VSVGANGRGPLGPMGLIGSRIDPRDLTNGGKVIGRLAVRTLPFGRSGRACPGPGREPQLHGTVTTAAPTPQCHRPGHGLRLSICPIRPWRKSRRGDRTFVPSAPGLNAY
jgi:hypothetical protein